MPCGSTVAVTFGGLHPTLMVAALEAAKVGNARPWSSYERNETSPPTTQLHHRVLNSLCALQRCENVRVTAITAISRKDQMFSGTPRIGLCRGPISRDASTHARSGSVTYVERNLDMSTFCPMAGPGPRP